MADPPGVVPDWFFGRKDDWGAPEDPDNVPPKCIAGPLEAASTGVPPKLTVYYLTRAIAAASWAAVASPTG